MKYIDKIHNKVAELNDQPWETSVEIFDISNMIPNLTVNAGVDKAITVPNSTVTLSGTASDSNGPVMSVKWSQVNGGTSSIASATAYATTVSGLTAGIYVYRLTATYTGGSTLSDDVQVTVNAVISMIKLSIIRNRVPVYSKSVPFASVAHFMPTLALQPGDIFKVENIL